MSGRGSNIGPSWGPAEDEIVRQLWVTGSSATEISRALKAKGFVRSRNSVIGRVQRLGIARTGRARAAQVEREARDERGRRSGAIKGAIAVSVRSKKPPTLKAVASVDGHLTPEQIRGQKAGRATALALTQSRPQVVSLKAVAVGGGGEDMAAAVGGVISELADALRVPEAGGSINGTGGVSLMALGAGQCRGPKGEGRAGEPLFCGAPVRAFRQSYCAACHKALHAPKPQTRQIDRSFTRQAVRHGW